MGKDAHATSGDALLATGREALRRRRLDEALKQFQACTEQAPADTSAWLGLGEVYLARGELKPAVESLAQARQRGEPSGEALHLLFLAEAARGHAMECARLLPEVQDEDFLETYAPLVWAVRQHERGRLARWFLPLTFPFSPESRRVLPAMLYLMLLWPKAATQRLAAEALGASRRRTRLEEMIRDRLRFLQGPRPLNLERLASLLLARAQTEAAETVACEAERLFPEREVFPLFAGHTRSFRGDLQAAAQHYERAARGSDQGQLTQLHLGASLVFVGKPGEAKEQFEPSAGVLETSPIAGFLSAIPLSVLEAVPASACIAAKPEVSCCAILADLIPAFSPGKQRWAGQPAWRRLAERVSLGSSRKRHRVTLKERRAIPCPVCESDQVHPFLKNQATGMSLARCAHCGHRFAQPMPAAESLAALYGPDYFTGKDLYARRVEERHAAGKPLPSEPIYEACLRWLERVDWQAWEKARGEGPTALDVGCASGACLMALRNRGWRVRGQDIIGGYEDYYRSLGIPYDACPIEQLGLPESSLDLCTLIHVLEHLPEPGVALKRLAGWLKPGGRLLLMTPLAETFTAWLSGKSWYDMSEHVQFFTLGSLLTLAERSGLRPLYWRTRVGAEVETPFRAWRRSRIGGALRQLIETLGQGDVIELVMEKEMQRV